MRQVVDVLVAQRVGDAGHAAAVIGAPARLEVLQLLDDVLEVLSGDPRDFVLAREPAKMAHRAQGLLGLELAQARSLRVRRVVLRRRLLLREEVGQLVHFVARHPSDPRLSGQHEDYLVHALKDYKLDRRKNPIMGAQAKTLSVADMENLAAYFAQLPGMMSHKR